MLNTRLTDRLGITHPIIGAPMAFAAGGRLAAAVSRAGGLGLIGGAYGDADWLEEQFAEAGNQKVGCGFITWSLAKQPQLLDQALARAPQAVFLSFGDPEPFARTIEAAGVPLICQVQTLKDARHAIDVGAAIIVVQGAEAGGHGESRATFTIVPEVADWIANNAPEVLLCAAGGVGDGRGLAAALMLGADGVVVGSRLWASEEALVHPNMHAAAVGASGDESLRSSVMDIARSLDWPERYSCRVLKNDFTDQWHGREDALRQAGSAVAEQWRAAWAAGDADNANTFVGEVTGLIDRIVPAGRIVETMAADAARLIAHHGDATVQGRG